MTTHPVWMIARREIKTRILTKAYIISMAVMLALIVIGTGVAYYFINRDSQPPVTHLAVAESTADLLPELEAAAAQQEVGLATSTMTADDAAAALVADGDQAIDAFLSGDPGSPQMLVAEQPDPGVLALVTAAVRSYVITDQISGLGGDPAAFEQTMAAAVPQVEALTDPAGSGFDGPAYGVSMVMISLLLGALISSGSMIAMGVVEEKTSRVVELLLATIKPTQLLAGKILGIGAFGLLQIAVLGGALTGGLAVLGLTADFGVSIGSALALLIVWFLLGYAVFALLFGGLAALVSRQEEIGSVTTPLMILIFIPYYTTLFLVPGDPETPLVRILSQVPFFAPFMIPVRQAFGGLSGWELALSLGLTLATIPLLIWVAARLYRRGVLHTGGRMKLSEALRG